ncbi:MAG: hypothetical protein AAF604_13440 [Acidobacteriota bacterium]
MKSRSIRLAAWLCLAVLAGSLAMPALAIAPERSEDVGERSFTESWGQFWTWVLKTLVPVVEPVPDGDDNTLVGSGDPPDPMNNSESGDEDERGPGLDPTGGG